MLKQVYGLTLWLVLIPAALSADELPLPWYREQGGQLFIFLSVGLIALLLAYALYCRSILKKQAAQKARDLHEASISMKKQRAMLSDKSFLVEIASTLNSISSTYDEITKILGAMDRKMGINQLVIMALDDGVDRPFTSVYRFTRQGVSDISRYFNYFPEGILDYLEYKEFFSCSETARLEYGEQNCFHVYGMRSVCVFPAFRLKAGVIGLFAYGCGIQKQWEAEETEMLQAISGMLFNAWKSYEEFHRRLAAEKKQTEAVKIAEESARMASIGVIAAGITHEINQPLNDIKMTADSILIWNAKNQGLLPAHFHRWLDTISGNVNRISEIIEQMRNYWCSPDQAVFVPLVVSDAVCHAVALIDQQLKAHGITLTIAELDKALVIEGRQVNLEQVILNLVVNAMHALESVENEEKNILIKIRRHDHQAIVEVIDNGPGLPETDLQKLFDPFYSTRTPYQGMGLGLAIVKRFIESMGGSVAASNNDNGGAHFHLAIPLSSEPGKI